MEEDSKCVGYFDRPPIKSTLCYITLGDYYLMLYRNKKVNDPNAGKWIGIGGKIEPGETPLEGVKREVKEETGLEPENFNFLGVISFRSDSAPAEEMYLYTALLPKDEVKEEADLPKIDCNEGTTGWIHRDKVLSLNLWEGDKEFLKPLMNGEKNINLMLRYEGDRLTGVCEAPAGKLPAAPIAISDRISYIPACEKPISSDVVIIRGDKTTYIFDTGSTLGCLEYLYSAPDDKEIIISHFHGDHTWWLTKHSREKDNLLDGDDFSTDYPQVRYGRLWVSPHTKKYTKEGTEVTERVVIEDGVKLEIIPFPSSHCKGSLILCVDDKYVFMGDSTYSTMKGGRVVYDVGKLKKGIEILEGLKADTCGISHDSKFLRNKKTVLRQLSAFYEKRKPGEPFIELR